MTIAFPEVPHGKPPLPAVCVSGYAEPMAVNPEATAHSFGPGSGKTERFLRFLLAELEARKMGVAELSHRTNLRYTVVQRWVDPDPERRVVPSPANCQLVADALGIDEVVVLEAAGHLRGRRVTSPLPPFWEELQALHRREERFMRNLAPEVWEFAKAIIEMRIDSTRLLVERHIEALERAVEEHTPGADGSS